MNAAEPLIAFAHVCKSFDGGHVQAVNDVSLQVAKSEFLAIVGGSGSGKTTLLRLANRLIDAGSGTIPCERADGREARGSGRLPPPYRLRVSERRAVSAYERRRQYRHHAKAPEMAGHRDRHQ